MIEKLICLFFGHKLYEPFCTYEQVVAGNRVLSTNMVDVTICQRCGRVEWSTKK